MRALEALGIHRLRRIPRDSVYDPQRTAINSHLFRRLIGDKMKDPLMGRPSGSSAWAEAQELMALVWGESPAVAEQTAVINVQGDQPFIDPAVIEAMVAEFRRRDPVPAVVTPVYGLKPDTVHNPNVVKTLLAHDGRALYFSRSAIPHVRDVDPADWHRHATYWGHVGMYGFRGDVLAGWDQLPASPLEDLERLEQLRLIEAGLTIATFAVQGTSLSVDTADQLEQARQMAASA